MARAEMVGRYGSEAYTEGYKVITTVRSDLQNAASQSVRDGLIDYDQRHGYRGPETRLPGQTRDAWLKHLGQQRSIGGLEPAIVTQVEKSGIMVMTRDGKEEAVTWDSMKWARPFLSNNSMGPMPRQPADVAQAGDQIRVQRQEDGTLRFVQVPAAQSALISWTRRTGRSARWSAASPSSRATTTARSKPSASRPSFKPFIYSAALDNGFTAASLVNDAPIVFVDEYLDKVWRPKNDTNTFLGPIPLRGLYKSRNMVSIRVLQGLGIERAISYITKFGFQRDELPRNFSLALGTATVTPMEIAGAWSVFANGGYKVNPYVIERIESRDGQVLYQANPPRVPVEEQVAAPDAEDAGNPGDPEHPESAEGEGSIEAQQVAAKAQTTFEPTPAERIIDARTAYIMTSMLQDDQARYRAPRPGAEAHRPGRQDRHHQRFQGWLVLRLQLRLRDQRLGRLRPAGDPGSPRVRRYRRATDLDQVHGLRPQGQADAHHGRAARHRQPAHRPGNRPFGRAGHSRRLFRDVQERGHPALGQRTAAGQLPGSPLPDDEGAPIDLF